MRHNILFLLFLDVPICKLEIISGYLIIFGALQRVLDFFSLIPHLLLHFRLFDSISYKLFNCPVMSIAHILLIKH
jgi:hypothetical protein